MNEQRKYIRTVCSALVEVSHPSFGMIELKARDLSDGGIFVHLSVHTGPPIGTVVKAKIKRHTGVINAEPIDMQVMHHNEGGMGLMFITL